VPREKHTSPKIDIIKHTSISSKHSEVENLQPPDFPWKNACITKSIPRRIKTKYLMQEISVAIDADPRGKDETPPEPENNGGNQYRQPRMLSSHLGLVCGY
jgi:hypothetical protein